MSASRLGQSRLFDELNQTNLRGNISILRLRLMLRDHAGSGLQHSRGMNVALVVEELRHADLLAENSSYLCHNLFFSVQLGSVAIGWRAFRLTPSLFAVVRSLNLPTTNDA